MSESEDETPLSREERKRLEYLAALGLMVKSWAYVEHALDASTLLIYSLAEGHTVERKLPRAFAQKVEFMKSVLVGLDTLAPYRDAGLKLMDRASELAEERNFIIHSAAIGGGPDDPSRLSRFRHKDGTYGVEAGSVTATQITTTTGSIVDLANDLLDFQKAALSQFGPIAVPLWERTT